MFAPRGLSVVALALLLLGCTAPVGPRSSEPGPGGPQPAAKSKRITIAFTGDVQALYPAIGTAQGLAVAGEEIVQELVNRGLTEADPWSVFRPQLADAAPSIDNGSWNVFPDGRMETTWKIKPGIRWHDSAPYTADDFAFTLPVVMDRELFPRQNPAYSAIERVEAPDPLTIIVTWKRPFIDADTLFSREFALPLPRHLLERFATEDRSAFAHLPYWGEEFVGAGPFALHEWVTGSHIVFRANEQYVLGRPKIDEIEARIFLDGNALLATVLAGGVDLMLGRDFGFDRAIVAEQQWKDGKVEARFSGTMTVWTQFVNPSPRVLSELQFRQALLHAIDRQQLVDLLFDGRSAIAHVFMGPNEPEFADVEGSIARYDYDQRLAGQLLERLGYTRAPDGTLRNAAGQRLGIEARFDRATETTIFPVADFWQQLGINVDPVAIPSQRLRDLEYQSTFPGLYLRGQSSRVSSAFPAYHSRAAPLPDNRWVGGNRSRYMNADLDSAIDRYYVTIPRAERVAALQAAIRHITDQLAAPTLFYSLQFTTIANRVENFVASKSSGAASKTWNSHLWDLK